MSTDAVDKQRQRMAYLIGRDVVGGAIHGNAAVTISKPRSTIAGLCKREALRVETRFLP